MNVEYINPFINSTINALTTMCSLSPTRGKPYLKTDPDEAFADISAIIGLAGEANGWVAVSFPRGTALKVAANMLGEKKVSIDADVQDAVGEIVNMIAGGAKADFSQKNLSFKIAIPTVVVGPNHLLSQKRDVPCIVIPFTAEGETFYIEVCLKAEKKNEPSQGETASQAQA